MIKLPIWNFLSWWTYKMPLFSCHNFKWKCTLAIQDFLGGKSGWVTSYIKSDTKNQTISTIFQVYFKNPFQVFSKKFLKKSRINDTKWNKIQFWIIFFSDQTSLFVSTFSAGNYAYYEPANQFSASGPVNHRLFELVTDRGVEGLCLLWCGV